MSYFDYQVTPRYVQGWHALQEIRRYTFGLGKKFLIVTACGPITEDVTRTIRESFAASMSEKVMPDIVDKNPRYNRQIAEAARFDALQSEAPELIFADLENYQVTDAVICEKAAWAAEEKVDVVIGVGGGKGLDFARAIAYHTNIKCVLVPTSASTNAAATQLCIINNEEGTRQEGCLFLPNYPSLVLVDTSILIGTPPQNLAAGIADQLCSYYECLYSARRLACTGQHSPLCWEIVNSSIELLYRYGREALEAAEKKQPDLAYETMLSLVLHNNGLARSVSGSGFAHLLSKAMITFSACRKQTPHGMQVAYGIIPMMVAEGEGMERIERYLDFCMELGLPIRLASIGLGDVTEQQLAAACDGVCNPSAELPFDGATMARCVFEAEKITAEYIRRREDV